MSKSRDENELQALLNELLMLRERIVLRASRQLNQYRDAGVLHSASACNLAHYLALREDDQRELQGRLALQGLSSLGRCEPHVMANLDAIIRLLMRISGQNMMMLMSGPCPSPGFAEGSQTLDTNTTTLFGPSSGERETRIMVTLPGEAAHNESLIPELLQRGADCVRINCAHDDAATWAAMINRIRHASDQFNRPCRILMDLAGHKLRTGAMEQGPAVRHLKVRRNEYGEIIAPAHLQLVPFGSPFEFHSGVGVQTLHLPPAWFPLLARWDSLAFTDTRNKPRHIEITGINLNGTLLAICPQPAWLGANCKMTRNRVDEEPLALGEIGEECLSGQMEAAQVHSGEPLLLSSQDTVGRRARYSDSGELLTPAVITCSMPEVLRHPRVGDAVWIDDGKIGCIVEKNTEEGLSLRVTHTSPKGARIRTDKGINFPDTRLHLPPLSEKDIADLDFVCRHADMVGFSFVESADDMRALMHELEQRGAANMPIIAKIETPTAVRNLPEILLSSMAQRPLGIMIARGDLAVELGSVRMAEIQEEMLWLCEAAHVPVIWATQVLESIAKKGVRSRPEFTDAAMGVRAECVMLNKGLYINDAVQALDKVLTRMQDHQRKKISRLRALHLNW